MMKFPHTSPRFLRAAVRALLGAGFTLLHATASATVDATAEYRLKAAYLYNFTKFVEWPAARTS